MNTRIYKEWVKFIASLDVEYSSYTAYAYNSLYIMLFIFTNWESMFKYACPHTAITIDLYDVNINNVISILKDEAKKYVSVSSDNTIVILSRSLVIDLKMPKEKRNKKV